MSDWISVEDRLPYADEAVLISDGTSVTAASRLVWAAYDNYRAGWLWQAHCVDGQEAEIAFRDNVQYWMPLPAPPLQK